MNRFAVSYSHHISIETASLRRGRFASTASGAGLEPRRNEVSSTHGLQVEPQLRTRQPSDRDARRISVVAVGRF